MDATGKKSVIKTWSRASMISPILSQYTMVTNLFLYMLLKTW
jgi:ribosomal protein S19